MEKNSDSFREIFQNFSDESQMSQKVDYDFSFFSISSNLSKFVIAFNFNKRKRSLKSLEEKIREIFDFSSDKRQCPKK